MPTGEEQERGAKKKNEITMSDVLAWLLFFLQNVIMLRLVFSLVCLLVRCQQFCRTRRREEGELVQYNWGLVFISNY